MVTVPVKELQVGDVLVLKLDPSPTVLFAEIIKLAPIKSVHRHLL